MVINVYFSPNGTTKTAAETIANGIGGSIQELDLLKNPLEKEKCLSGEDLLLVSLPVYAGRIPSVAGNMLHNLKGSKTPAIAAVVYGNREYDDALIELRDLLTEQGFVVIGAAALVAQHSIFPAVAAGRPDKQDFQEMEHFAGHCAEILRSSSYPEDQLISVKGNEVYREPAKVPVKPKTSKTCSRCGLCASLCPVHAIRKENPAKYDRRICISCGACIRHCPQGAKKFGGAVYKIGSVMFKRKFSSYKKPELFYLE